MEVQDLAIDLLKADPRNSRKHSKRNIEIVAKSLERFGQQTPVVIDNNYVVKKGNATLIAARSLGWKMISCVVTELDALNARAYAITDNRSGDPDVGSEWDVEVLPDELSALRDDGIDLDDLGFQDDEIEKLVRVSGYTRGMGTKQDDPPPPPVDAQTRAGDLWRLGDHQVLCGDSTLPVDVAKAMSEQKAQLTITDPPYNVNYGTTKGSEFKQRPLENDDQNPEEFGDFCARFAAGIQLVCDGCVYCFGPPGPDGRIMFGELDAAFHCSTTIIWNKDRFTLGRGKYQNKYELCWFGWTDNGNRFCNDRTLTNVWDVDRPKASKEHPTMKPIELLAMAIEHASVLNDLIFDPFLGSGTTLIAAEQLGRRCYGLEISPAYCDVICQRYFNLTGVRAVTADGKEFQPLEPATAVK